MPPVGRRRAYNGRVQRDPAVVDELDDRKEADQAKGEESDCIVWRRFDELSLKSQ